MLGKIEGRRRGQQRMRWGTKEIKFYVYLNKTNKCVERKGKKGRKTRYANLNKGR